MHQVRVGMVAAGGLSVKEEAAGAAASPCYSWPSTDMGARRGSAAGENPECWGWQSNGGSSVAAPLLKARPGEGRPSLMTARSGLEARCRATAVPAPFEAPPQWLGAICLMCHDPSHHLLIAFVAPSRPPAGLYVYNKVDVCSMEEVDEIARWAGSAHSMGSRGSARSRGAMFTAGHTMHSRTLGSPSLAWRLLIPRPQLGRPAA
jgi:hypothetical protein